MKTQPRIPLVVIVSIADVGPAVTAVAESTERVLSAPASELGARVVFVHVRQFKDLLQRLELFARADRIVFTGIHEVVARFVRLLRVDLCFETPMSFYFHGIAASGGLGLHSFDDLLLERDSFILSSREEERAVRTIFRKPRFHIVPFVVDQGPPARAKGTSMKRLPSPVLVFAARISEQKNLHTLLTALWLLKRRTPAVTIPLHVFGRADRWGTQEMDVKSRHYAAFVRSLVRSLDLESSVTCH